MQENQNPEKKRVAAYCRVSTNLEIQTMSYKTQKESFEKDISEHPGWVLVDIYADKGRTGLNMDRPGMKKLLEDVDKGLIDIIIVKSISRISRNTVDLLKFVRLMRSKNVEVYCCKESLSSLSMNSEILLTVLAALAQEESHSISENYKTGIRARFKMGEPIIGEMYGYEKVAKNTWGIKESEAEVIRQIFDWYLQGYSHPQIAKKLNERGISSPNQCKIGWKAAVISKLMNNEKICGDYLMQKTYVVDLLEGKSVSNKNAVVPQYFKKDHHEAIIPREQFYEVKKIMTMKNTLNGCAQYPFYGVLRCPYCQSPMIRIFAGRGNFSNLWFCSGNGEGRIQKERSSCELFLVNHDYLIRTITEAIEELSPDDNEDIRWAQTALQNVRTLSAGVVRRLIESITYKDNFTVEIRWKDGNVTTRTIEYEHPKHMPVLIDEGLEDLSYKNGRKPNSLFSEISLKARKRMESMCRNAEIIRIEGTDILTVRPTGTKYKDSNTESEDND